MTSVVFPPSVTLERDEGEGKYVQIRGLVFGFYNGSTQFPIQREYYKPSYIFGLRYTLPRE